MHIAALRGIAGAVLLTGVTVTWVPFHSTIYPYTVSQPSSFKHAVVPVSLDENVDLFAPSVGSATTHVTISATPGTELQSEVSYLRSIDGHNIKRVGSMHVAGKRRNLVRAQFDGIGGKWTIEQVCFMAKGYVWRLTASYAPQFKSMRSLMIRMIGSFKLVPGAR